MTTAARTVLPLVAAAALLAVMPAAAQTPNPLPARLATIQAKRVLSKIAGTVRAEPEGQGRTRVTVMFNAPPPAPQALTLMNGSQCTDHLDRSANLIALNPPQGRMSSTVVNIPFSAFRSRSYMVDIRNATTQADLEEACARF